MIRVDAAGPADVGDLARLHARSFPDAPWSEEEISRLMALPSVRGLVVRVRRAVRGFILVQRAADEAEILTLAVDPADRRAGLGRDLVRAAMGLARADGVVRMSLEVAADNAPARGLYESVGFQVRGRRKGYYQRPSGPQDALILGHGLVLEAKGDDPMIDE